MTARNSFEDMLAGFAPIADVDAINTLNDPDKCVTLRIDQLVPYASNREVTREKAELMAESLREFGQLQPILVRPIEGLDGKYEICAGHNRYFGQLINAETHPGEPSYRLLKAVIRKMGDAEMEISNAVANLYMDPPAAEERARLYAVLKERVPGLRVENPDKYAGVPTAQIVADLVKDMGGKTSRATVNRDLKAAREAEEATKALELVQPAWRKLYEAGEVDDASMAKISRLDPKTQLQVYGDWERNRKKSYLRERIALTDASDAERLMIKTIKAATESFERLLRIRRAGFYVEEEPIARMRTLIDELREIDEEEANA